LSLNGNLSFLMKDYENTCWHGGNSSYLVATKWILTFATC